MKRVTLDTYRFSGFHKSHVGAVKSCLDYFDIPCTAPWVYGLTGSAFIMVVDEELTAPNMGEPEDQIFELARHLGVQIQGIQTFADAESFDSLQREAWDMARSALDRGLPVFAKELDLGNETSVIYAYDEEGYYTHSWHGGTGHEGAEDVIPWTKLGRNYCPCAACRAKADTTSERQDAVYRGDPKDGGFLSLHYAEKVQPSDDITALREAVAFVLAFTRRERYTWGGRTFYSGAAAYDQWMDTIRRNTIQGFYMGYFVDIAYESRRHARRFLQEAGERFSGELAGQLAIAAEHYKRTEEAFGEMNKLFPWMQPRAPIDDPDRRQQALELLRDIRKLEMEALKQLGRVGML